MELIEAQEGLQ